MSGWVPMPADAWPMIASGLAKPWSEEAARFDLRWHADRGALPSRTTLADRWGWSPGEVRTELRHPDRWWDPGKGAPPTSRDELTRGRPALTRADPETTREEQSNHDNRPDLTRADPETTSADPTTPHARVVSPSPSPTPAPSDQQTDVAPAEPAVPDRYDEAALYFGEIVHRAVGRRPSKGPERKSKLGQRLLTAVRKDADRVLDAMRFVAEGRADKADFLRRYDGLTVETVLRHVDEYAELWRVEQEPGWRPRGPPGPPRRGQSTAGDGVLDELAERYRREREARDGDDRGRDRGVAGHRSDRDRPALDDPGGHGPWGPGLDGRAR